MQNLKSSKLRPNQELSEYLEKPTSREELKTIMESEVFRSFLKYTEDRFIERYPTRSEIEHVQVANMYSVNGVKEFLELLELEAKELVFQEKTTLTDDYLEAFAD